MKKLKNEAQLVKLALHIGSEYSKNRGYKDFGKGISPKDKVECIYRLLVKDGLIQPLSEDKEDGPSMKRRIVLWLIKKLPKDHVLLN